MWILKLQNKKVQVCFASVYFPNPPNYPIDLPYLFNCPYDKKANQFLFVLLYQHDLYNAVGYGVVIV